MKHIAVGLELNRLDEYLLNYLNRTSSFLKPTAVTFFNIHQEELAPAILQKFPELTDSIDTHYIKEMVHETANLKNLTAELHYKAITGNVLKNILHIANADDTDLLILGRKKNKEERHLQFKEIIRNAVSDVLIVPEYKVEKHKTILVAIDYSVYSKDALLKAMDIAKHADLKLVIQHVYEVPIGYSKTGKSFVEFAKIMKGHAENHMKDFVKDIDLSEVNHEFKYTLNDHHSTSKAIKSAIEEVHPQLVILASKGKNLFTALLVGSTAESLLTCSKIKIPLLLTRRRDKRTSIWDVIKEF